MCIKDTSKHHEHITDTCATSLIEYWHMCHMSRNFDIFPLIPRSDIVNISKLTDSGNYQSVWPQTHYDITYHLNTIGLSVILVIMCVSTFKAELILYIHVHMFLLLFICQLYFYWFFRNLLQRNKHRWRRSMKFVLNLLIGGWQKKMDS